MKQSVQVANGREPLHFSTHSPVKQSYGFN